MLTFLSHTNQPIDRRRRLMVMAGQIHLKFELGKRYFHIMEIIENSLLQEFIKDHTCPTSSEENNFQNENVTIYVANFEALVFIISSIYDTLAKLINEFYPFQKNPKEIYFSGLIKNITRSGCIIPTTISQELLRINNEWYGIKQPPEMFNLMRNFLAHNSDYWGMIQQNNLGLEKNYCVTNPFNEFFIVDEEINNTNPRPFQCHSKKKIVFLTEYAKLILDESGKCIYPIFKELKIDGWKNITWKIEPLHASILDNVKDKNASI